MDDTPTNGCPVEIIAKVRALKIALLPRDFPVERQNSNVVVNNEVSGIALTCILLFGCFASVSAKVAHDKGGDFELTNKQRIEAGKSKVDELMTKAKRSDCWKKAVEGIEKRCKNLGDTEQSYLAIDFTNCHQSKSGRKIYFCSR